MFCFLLFFLLQNEESKEVKRIKDQLKAIKAGELTADQIEL